MCVSCFVYRHTRNSHILQKNAEYLYMWYFFCIFAGCYGTGVVLMPLQKSVSLHFVEYMQNTYRYSILLLIGVLMFPLWGRGVLAQNGSSSPYSRYGYGDLNDNVPNTYRAMGGVGLGMRSNKVINPAQPASFTAGDSLTFMFDLAASAMWSTYADASGRRNKANGNLEYLSLQFPLYKRYVAFSAGVLPYSSVGYGLAVADSIRSDYHYVQSYVGAGGISQVYGGLSFNICDWVALGANVYYMFGTTTNTRTLTFVETGLRTISQESTLRVSSVRFRYGAQFFHTFGDHTIVLGGVFENKQKMSSVSYTTIETTTADTVSVIEGGFELPMVYGGGISYGWADRLTLAFDYQRQCMASALYEGSTNRFRDRSRYSAGVEYRHNPNGRRYYERMLWRCGVNVADSYALEGKAPDITASIGMGFPLRTAATVFNVTLEYTHRGDKTTLQENSLRLTINAAISENWFFKRKL